MMDNVLVHFTSGKVIDVQNVEKIISNPFDSTIRLQQLDGEDTVILGSKIDFMNVGKDIETIWRKQEEL